jgi:hypothetical protein
VSDAKISNPLFLKGMAQYAKKCPDVNRGIFCYNKDGNGSLLSQFLEPFQVSMSDIRHRLSVEKSVVLA